MIYIDVERSFETKQITAFTIRGHANSGPYGFDIVCAAVSALSIGTVNAIWQLCGIKLPTKEGAEGGYLHCDVPKDLKETTAHDVQLLIEGMLVGLKDIAKEYRQFVTVAERRT